MASTASLEKLIFLMLAGLVVYVIYYAVMPKWSFHILVRNGIVEIRKGVASNKRAELIDFLTQHVNVTGSYAIFGRRERNGRLVIQFKGEINDGVKQRIRNFFQSFPILH